MALDLQLTTQAAKAQLDALEKSVAALKGAFAGFRVTKGFENTLSALSGFQGVSASAASSVGTLATNLGKLGAGDAAKVTALVKSLRQLVNLNLGGLSGQIEKVNGALQRLRTPPGVGRLAGQLTTIGDAARRSASGINTLQGALARVRPPPGLGGIAQQLRAFQQQSRSAAGGVNAFGGAMRGASQVAAGFGVVLGGVGLANFVKGSYDAINSTDRFMALMKQFTGTAKGAADELAFVRGVADRLAQPISVLQDSYSKLAVAMKGAGAGGDQIRGTFEKFSTVFRVLNLSQDQVARGFKGIEQVYTKGAVQMEELKGQLGELFPAFTLLAKGMNISTAALMKLVEQGKVPASAMMKLADAAIQAYGGALPDSLKTASAAFNNLSNSIFRIQESFGRGLFEGVTPAINDLASALDSVDVQKNIQDIGRLVGVLAGGLIKAIQFVISNWNVLKYALGGLAALKVTSMIGGMALALGQFATAARSAGIVAGLVSAGFGGLAKSAVNIAFVFGAIARAVGPVIGLIIRLVMNLTPVGRILTVLGIVISGGVYLWSKYGSSATAAGNATASVGQKASAAIGPMGNLADAATKAETAMASLGKLHEIAAIGELKRLAEGAQQSGASAEEVTKKWQVFWDAVGGFSNEAAQAVVEMNAVADAASKGNPEAQAKFWNAYARAMKLTGQSAGDAKDDVSGAGNAAQQAGQKAAQAAGGVQALGNKFSQSAGQANAAANSYDRAASAAARWADNAAHNPSGASLPLTGGGSSSPNDSEGVEYYDGGGITGKPGARRSYAPMGMFAGAPQFADGGISDGGIPAILHPNEAVVPLTGGGSIPVANVSQGQGSLLLYKPLNELLVLTRLQRNDVSRVVDQLQILTALVKEEFDQVQVRQDFLANDRMTQLMKQLQAHFASLEIKIGSGGGGGGGSGLDSGGGFGGVVGPGTSKIDEIAALTDVRVKSIQQAGTMSGGQGGRIGGAFLYNGKITAQYSPLGHEAMADMVQRDLDLLKARYAAGLVSDKELDRRLTALRKGSGKGADHAGFATGSPNASKDLKGGFRATLHKDEAVIPLPDGRSVPVSFSGGLDSAMSAMREDARKNVSDIRDMVMARPRASTNAPAAGNQFNIVMHFPNADAQSFKASQEQVKQMLRAEMDRATRKIGTRSATDDPTVSNPRGERPSVSRPR